MGDAPLPQMKIMIVDDSKFNLTILSEALKGDYEVITASTGKEALEKAAYYTPDLILLDVLMPDMDGHEVCKKIKHQLSTHKIPIIFITSKNKEEDEVKGLSLGAVDYITKPFRLPIVQARVRTHLELKYKTDLLENISSRDGLTGIYNRRRFDEALSTEWNRARRTNQPLSLIMLDLDFFKQYNDRYGHLYGDECLKAVAKTLSTTLKRAADFVARYGGEEFVALLPETPLEKAIFMAEKIRKKVESLHIEHEDSTLSPQVTVSIGVASTIPKQKADYNMLIEKADHALYDAKQSGRNQVKG